MLETIRSNLGNYQAPVDEAFTGGRAAVLIPLIERPEPTILLTLRAANLSSHGGEVALPGGKVDAQDADLAATALRECEEEIALPQERVRLIGRLAPFISKHGLQVTPFVGLIGEHEELRASRTEIEALFEVPVAWLLQDPRVGTDLVIRHGIEMRMPVYHYAGHKIWGLTAMVLVEFLNRSLHAGIP